MPKQLFKHARKLHRLLGYVLAIQVIFWIGGGLIMSAIPLEKVHGKHLATKQLENPFQQSDYLAALDPIIAQFDKVSRVAFSHLLDTPVYRIYHSKGVSVFNARSGQPMTDLNKDMTAKLAKQHFLGDVTPANIELLDKAPREAGFRENIWHVSYDDSVSTSLYFSATTGELVTVRSDLWRIFDFVWMLHIMDYDEREDFNHPLLIVFSASALLFALSGALLAFQQIRIRRFKRKSVVSP